MQFGESNALGFVRVQMISQGASKRARCLTPSPSNHRHNASSPSRSKVPSPFPTAIHIPPGITVA
ncbi:hypothetical protein BU23DRAFT_551602 [Bimuria novae-zelandiae CBS 107.79]|uniref:Uncharacterized protein n=1 Tax=Bimuria novae-zelandiae CBS 107.79 TaxID=1447943 RepID=A0A6A5VLU9_9PLEO|nr:hypothetical protein BU23DRAFT_551602 [Bimuria novae-zelandiae CBS 107.79]